MLAFTLLASLASAINWLFVLGSIGALPPFPATIREVGRSIAREAQPFFLPTTAVVCAYNLDAQFIHGSFGDRFLYALGLVANILFYSVYKDDDDDRWRKRRKKVTEAIKRVGSRLVVSPQGAPS